MELVYVGLLFGLFILPHVLQRVRVPTAITSFVLGGACALGFGLFTQDHTIALLSTLGIVALFLFAGLDVEAPQAPRLALDAAAAAPSRSREPAARR